MIGGNYQSSPEQTPNVEREVAAWLKTLDFKTDVVGSLVVQLADRLAPVLAPPNKAEQDKGVECRAGCDVAARIQGQVARLSDVERALGDLLQRLEV